MSEAMNIFPRVARYSMYRIIEINKNHPNGLAIDIPCLLDRLFIFNTPIWE